MDEYIIISEYDYIIYIRIYKYNVWIPFLSRSKQEAIYVTILLSCSLDAFSLLPMMPSISSMKRRAGEFRELNISLI